MLEPVYGDAGEEEEAAEDAYEPAIELSWI